MKILSICIPTMNQPKEVFRLLESLSKQKSPEVEIIVNDGSFNDETKKIVDKYIKLLDIKYINNKPGRSVDQALFDLTELALGKYVWWIGDDDVASKSIERILKVLKQYPNLSFMYIDPQILENSLFHMNLSHSRFFKDKNELLEKAGTALGFISSCLFNNIDKKQLEESREYIGTYFVNLFIVLQVISKNEDLYYLKGPTVYCHPTSVDTLKKTKVTDDGVINNGAFEVFGVNFKNIIMHFSMFYEKKTIRKVITKSFGSMWRGLLVAWAGGWDEPKGKRIKMIKNFYMYPESWPALILFCMPLSIIKLMYKMYKFFKYQIFLK